jgi:hypothetical protein
MRCDPPKTTLGVDKIVACTEEPVCRITRFIYNYYYYYYTVTTIIILKCSTLIIILSNFVRNVLRINYGEFQRRTSAYKLRRNSADKLSCLGSENKVAGGRFNTHT